MKQFTSSTEANKALDELAFGEVVEIAGRRHRVINFLGSKLFKLLGTSNPPASVKAISEVTGRQYAGGVHGRGAFKSPSEEE